MPLALFLRMAKPASWRDLATFAGFIPPTPATLRPVRVVLTATVIVLLAGHGAPSLAGKPAFVHNLASLLPGDAAVVLPILGGFELALAAAVAVRVSPPLLVFVTAWKIITEALFMTAGASVWEWIERGGSYAAPLALAIVVAHVQRLMPRRP